MFWRTTFNTTQIYNLKQNGSIIIISGTKVYDFTEYVNNHTHPGSNDIIKRFSILERDCINDYKFHNTKAKNVWHNYFIGYLETKPSK